MGISGRGRALALVPAMMAGPASATVTFELELGPIDDIEDAPPAAFADFQLGETVRIRVSMDETVPDRIGGDGRARFEDPDADLFLIGQTSGVLVRRYAGLKIQAEDDRYSSPDDVTGTYVYPDIAGSNMEAIASGALWFIGNAIDWTSDGNLGVDADVPPDLLAGFLSPAVSLYGGAQAAIVRPDPASVTGGTLRVLRIRPLSDDIRGAVAAVPAPPAGLALLGGLGALAAAGRRRRAAA